MSTANNRTVFRVNKISSRFVVPLVLHKMLELSTEIVDTYSCSQCSHRNESIFQLAHHIQRNHSNIYAAELYHATDELEQFHCICSDYNSYYQFELYEHCKQVHNPGTGNNKNATSCETVGKYQCRDCRYESYTSLSLAKHYSLCRKKPTGEPQEMEVKAEGIEPSNLTEAPVRTIRFVGVMESNMWTDDAGEKIRYQCSHCSYRTNQTSRLREHDKTHVANEEMNWFHCNQCSYRARQKSSVKTHKMLQHSTDEETNWFQCNDCSYRAKLKSRLNKHIINKHVADDKVNWFQCTHCSYRTKAKSNLKTHHASKHATNEEISWFQCHHCSYRSKYKSHLKEHMTIHATDEQINWLQCNDCPYRAKREGNLKTHMLQHATTKEIEWFQCNDCSYRAKQKSHLKQHMSVHTADEEIKWYQCNHCSHRSKRRSHLKKHVTNKHATDEEIDWFQCNHCSHRAKQKSDLKRHISIHATV